MRFVTKMIQPSQELVRFGIISVLGIVVDLAAAWVLAHLFSVPLTLAALISFAVAALFNYVLHENWTFTAGSASAKRGALYFLGLCVTLASRLAAIASLQWLFSTGYGRELFILVPAVCFSFCVNYLFCKFVVFSRSTPSPKVVSMTETEGSQITTKDHLILESPAFEAQTHGEKQFDYVLVIPVINEGERIRMQLQRIHAANLPVDVVVADGGSTDGSLDDAILKETGVRALLIKRGAGRLSAQLRMAYAWCLNEGYAGIVTIDGNGKDNVEAVAAFVDKLMEGYDYVQGSRYLSGGKAENTPLERTIGNRLIHAPLMSMAGRHWFTDTTNGFRGYSRAYLLHPQVQPFRDVFMNYELLFYLTARAGQLGMRICEIPVQRSYPIGEKVPTKITGVRSKLAVLKQLFAAAGGGFIPVD